MVGCRKAQTSKTAGMNAHEGIPGLISCAVRLLAWQMQPGLSSATNDYTVYDSYNKVMT